MRTLCSVSLLLWMFCPELVAARSYRFEANAVIRESLRPLATASPNPIWSSLLPVPQDYRIAQIVSDRTGATYVAASRIIPLSPGNPASTGSSSDVLVAKFDAAGNLLFTSTLSGKGTDQVTSIAVDPAGNIYVAGSTTSVNFPLRGALQTTSACSRAVTSCVSPTGFITKLSPDGSALIYSTYFGGVKGKSSVNAITTDEKGNTYVAGSTNASDYPHTTGLPAGLVSEGLSGREGAFFARISPLGNSLLYSGVVTGGALACGCCSSCFLAQRTARAVAVALDSAGNLFIAGNTNTTDLPTTPGAYLTKGIGPFVAKINAAGTSLGGLTYLSRGVNYFFAGAPSPLAAIAVDAGGSVYVSGSSEEATFPTSVGGYQTQLKGTSDATVVKLSSDLSKIEWSTFVGGSGGDTAKSVSVDSAGVVWVAGSTGSTNFPNVDGWTTGSDFLVALDASGSALTHSALYPGGTSNLVTADSAGVIHLGGTALVSVISPATKSSNIFVVQNSAAGLRQTQVARGEIVSILGFDIGPSVAAIATPDSSGIYPTSLSGVQVTVNGTPAPLLYASAGQINAVVPLGITGETATFQVTSATQSPAAFTAAVAFSAPGIFRIDPEYAVALNQDGTINSATNPAPLFSVVAIWMTGVDGIDPALKDGQVQMSAGNTNCCQVQLQNKDVPVLYAGDAPGTITGLTQVNFQVASTFGQLAVGSGGRWDAAFIYVQ